MIRLQSTVCLANLMKENSHRSELLTQCLLHDRAELLEEENVWIKIKLKFNGTEGWTLKSQFETIDEEAFNGQASGIYAYHHHDIKHILPGSFLFQDEIKEGYEKFQSIQDLEESIRTIALSFLNAPYMWGGITCHGIDCSGLSQIVYRYHNIPLTSFAAEQFTQGKVLDFLQDAQCGDLAFFDEPDGSITHVGILLSSNEIIHATEKAGRVVIDSIDQEGIISKRNGKRTHKLRIVKRLI